MVVGRCPRGLGVGPWPLCCGVCGGQGTEAEGVSDMCCCARVIKGGSKSALYITTIQRVASVATYVAGFDVGDR